MWAWAFALYLIGVIMFGAWVRITGSGAGCGSHWPTCDGEIIPTALDIKKKIEFTHRVTSGLCGIFGIALIVAAKRTFGVGKVFWAAVVTMIFILIEGLIGAVIVRKELVAQDTSVARAIVISLHLVNTLILMAASSMTAWWSGRRRGPLLWSQAPWFKWLLPVALGTLILTCMTGAITALGDTLFPTAAKLDGSLWTHVKEEVSAGEHFLIRLRALHPVIAVLSAAALGVIANLVAGHERASQGARRWAKGLGALVALQVLFGVINVALAAPGWAQLTHLFLAQAIWIAAVVMGASILEQDPHA